MMNPVHRAGLVAVVVTAAVWVAAGAGRRDEGPGTPTVAGGTAVTAGVIAVDPQRLRTYAHSHPTPVYWAGVRPRTTLELGTAEQGTTLLRYLPPGRPIGDRAGHLLVATYEIANPLAAVKRSALVPGAETRLLPSNGYAVFNRSMPTSVYFAYPRSDVQVQVFDPIPGRALTLVLSGAVKPVSAARTG